MIFIRETTRGRSIPALFLVIFVLITIIIGCSDSDDDDSPNSINNSTPSVSISTYQESLEANNQIDMSTLAQNPTPYIPPQCYTKVLDENEQAHNPCYTCHINGKHPNPVDDRFLQSEYSLPPEVSFNPWANFFKNRQTELSKITDSEILTYVRTSNYLAANNTIKIAEELPEEWPGYRPDCYFNFDENGFDINPNTGEMTGWRAFRYQPFLGTFWPTNGSFDDVLIRLPEIFRVDVNERLSTEVYKYNLAVVEALIKQTSINTEPINEQLTNCDLDGNGIIQTAEKIDWTSLNNCTSHFAGAAGELEKSGEISFYPGLYPKSTEFLHSLRYIDWEDTSNTPSMAERFKELRYMRKVQYLPAEALQDLYNQDQFEDADTDESSLDKYYGDFSTGIYTDQGWVLQGFIEDKNGELRPQTKEESVYCVGCHSNIGAISDGTFALPRKFDTDNGWKHWSQVGLQGVDDQTVYYEKFGEVKEYAFYLKQNGYGDEFRENEEVREKFFTENGELDQDMISQMEDNITVLLYPSKERALRLNKLYKIIVEEQSFNEGRETLMEGAFNVYMKIVPNMGSGLDEVVY